METELPVSTDPTPHGAVYLLPGDGKSFYANGHTYVLTTERKVLEDNTPMPDGTFTALLVFFENKVYRKDQQHQWWLWAGGTFVPSRAPTCIPSGRPPSVDAIMAELGVLSAASLAMVASLGRMQILIFSLQCELRGQV